MNHVAKRSLTMVSRMEPFPLLTFLFIAAVFFLSQHDLYYSTKITEQYNHSGDFIVTAVAEGSVSRRIAILGLGLFAAVNLILYRGTRIRINGLLGWAMVFFAGWSALSLAWAADPTLTFRRLAVFAILCLAAADVARRFSLRQIILLIFSWSALFLIVGISAELVLGTFRPFTSAYRFAGTLHPNHQGINCALLFLSGVAAADTEKRKRTLFRGCAFMGLAFLILTGSRTAFAAALLAFATYFNVTRSRQSKASWAIGLGIGFCLLLMVLGNRSLPDLKDALMLGRRDPVSTVDSFNGRAEVWEEVSRYIYKRPIAGYGYGGFWTPKHIAKISDAEMWGVGEGHSTYIDCLLNLGLVGLTAYVLVLLVGIKRSFAIHMISQAPTFAFSSAFLVFCGLEGLLESAILQSVFVIFVTIAIMIHLGFRHLPFIPDKRKR